MLAKFNFSRRDWLRWGLGTSASLASLPRRCRRCCSNSSWPAAWNGMPAAGSASEGGYDRRRRPIRLTAIAMIGLATASATSDMIGSIMPATKAMTPIAIGTRLPRMRSRHCSLETSSRTRCRRRTALRVSRKPNAVTRAEIFFDGLRLGGRFDDDKLHEVIKVPCVYARKWGP